MALQTSGMISLNDMHVEAGGTTGTACTINDSDIRGLIGASSGAAMDFADWYGASGSLDTQVVTVERKTVYFLARAGAYVGSPFNLGSITDGTCDFKSNATVKGIMWSNQDGGYLQFILDGVQSNSGFTTMTVNGTSYSRSSAVFSSSSTSTWKWSGVPDPFTANGTTTTVTWA